MRSASALPDTRQRRRYAVAELRWRHMPRAATLMPRPDTRAPKRRYCRTVAAADLCRAVERCRAVPDAALMPRALCGAIRARRRHVVARDTPLRRSPMLKIFAIARRRAFFFRSPPPRRHAARCTRALRALSSAVIRARERRAPRCRDAKAAAATNAADAAFAAYALREVFATPLPVRRLSIFSAFS
jgi:hypothetical protein